MTYQGLYVEINVLCILILLYILFCIRTINKQTKIILFCALIYTILALLTLDSLWILLEHRPTVSAIRLNSFINIVFYILTGLVGYLWLLYTEYTINPHKLLSHKTKLLWSIPLLILSVLCISSPWTGLIFYVDQFNSYHRGMLYFLQVILSYGYLVVATIRVLQQLNHENNLQRRSELLTLISFAVLPAIAGILDVFVNTFSLLWPACTLSTLMVFVNLQSYQISTDGLTGLNNRRQFDRYLQSLVLNHHRDTDFYLFLLDVNAFKTINDRYGHTEGDCALLKTADLLRSVCAKRSAFVARYGGDEFVLILHTTHLEEAQQFLETIQQAFNNNNLANHKEYDLSVSIGYVCCKPQERATMLSLVKAADEALYQNKARSKSGR